MTMQYTFDPAQLPEYEIIGELAGPDNAKVLLATRRADRRAVTISILREPPGDEGNALSHVAADTTLLSGATHPHLVPVLEGRWLGNEALAVVSERVPSPTLEEMLARRDEEFPYARVAAILRDINAALEWARERKVVHRSVRLDGVYVEPGSDHVRVSFAPTALSATGIPGANDDARTIALLARAMLTRSVMAPERENAPLAELRPGLPGRVIAQTDALTTAGQGSEAPDVQGYIASIAMAEELKRAEVEREAVRLEMEEEQRRIRAELVAEREAHDRDLADQAKRFADERQRERESMTKERDSAVRAVAKERKEMAELLAKERKEMEGLLAKERERMDKELAKARSELDKERRLVARDREKLAREREAQQREVERTRQQLAGELAALQAQASLYEKTSELPVARHADGSVRQELEATPLMDHVRDAPSEQDEIEEPYDEIVEPHDEIVDTDDDTTVAPNEPESPRSRPSSPGSGSAALPTAGLAAWPRFRERGGRAWRAAGMALLVLMVLVGASVVVMSRKNGRAAGMAERAEERGVELQVVDSVAGALAPSAVDSLRPVAPTVAPAPGTAATRLPAMEQPSPTPARSEVIIPRRAPPRQADSTPPSPVVAQPDTMTQLPFTRPDSARADSVTRSRLDSLRVVLPKVDSLLPRRDTLPRRGTD